MDAKKAFVFFMLLEGSLAVKLLTSNKETKKVFNGRIVKRIRIKSGFLKAVENAERKLISFDNSTLVKNRRDNMIKLRQALDKQIEPNSTSRKIKATLKHNMRDTNSRKNTQR